MAQQMGLTEFFVMEAGDYLERLDPLVSGIEEFDPEDMVELARALRGSALMANQQSIGAAAEALENLARAVQQERVPWNEVAKQATVRAVEDLKSLIDKVADWTESEDAQAAQVAAELQAAAAVLPNAWPSRPHAEVDSGSDVVPVQSLYYEDTGPRAVESGTEAAVSVDQEHPESLALSWAQYERLLEGIGAGEASVEELLAGPPTAPAGTADAVPTDTDAPVGYAAVEESIVPITDLCYSGPAALERARGVTNQIGGALAEPTLDRPFLTELIEELLDLIRLNSTHKE